MILCLPELCDLQRPDAAHSFEWLPCQASWGLAAHVVVALGQRCGWRGEPIGGGSSSCSLSPPPTDLGGLHPTPCLCPAPSPLSGLRPRAAPALSSPVAAGGGGWRAAPRLCASQRLVALLKIVCLFFLAGFGILLSHVFLIIP